MDSGTRIQDLEVTALQALVTRYPWFSYAREVLLCRLVELEPQCLEGRYRENLVFFPRRDAVLLRCRAIAEDGKGKDTEDMLSVEMLLDAEEDMELLSDVEISGGEQAHEPVFEVDFDGGEEDGNYQLVKEKPKIVVVGGDYFSKEDLAQLNEEEKAAEIRLGAPAAACGDCDPIECSQEVPDYNSMDFVTETLAGIYADQGYYDKAIEVYAKLILLYPEKSAYFAALVNEIKSKN